MEEIIITNLDSLNDFARKFSTELRGGIVVALSGDLGVGKTTLTQLVAKHLGIKNILNSPTFTILKVYPVANSAFKQFCHIDSYRLENEKNHLELEEYLGDADTVCFVEWAEKIKAQLPFHTIWLKLAARPNGSRLLIRD